MSEPSSVRKTYKTVVNVIYALFALLIAAAAISSCSSADAEGKEAPNVIFIAIVLMIVLAAANEIRSGLLFLPDWKTASLREKILHAALLFFAVMMFAASFVESGSGTVIFSIFVLAALRLFLWITDLSEKNRKEMEQKR